MTSNHHQMNESAPRITLASSRNGDTIVVKSAGRAVMPGWTASEIAADRENLQNEFTLLSRLSHPNWAQPLGYFRFAHSEGFLVKVAEGKSLADTLKNRDLDWVEAVRICRSVLAALGHLHAMGYVHLDLKPDHIFLNSDVGPEAGQDAGSNAGPDAGPESGPKSVTLIDLGLSAPVHSRCGRGTPRYAAPEALEDKLAVDGRTDLYSVGVILWELLMKQPLFPGANAAEVLAHRFDPLRDRATAPELPDSTIEPLRRLVARLLSPQMDERPVDAAEVTRQIDMFLPDSMPLDVPSSSAKQETLPVVAPLIGRLEIEQEFDAFLDTCLPTAGKEPTSFEVQLVGEAGVGCRRLARHLIARAAVRGWRSELCESESRIATLYSPSPHGGSNVSSSTSSTASSTVSLTTRILAPGRRLIEEEDAAQFDRTGVLHVVVPPLSHASSVRLAHLRVHSATLADEIATLSLGNPTLLRALLAEVRPVHDLLSEQQDHEWLEKLEPPKDWVRWAEHTLDGLSSTARTTVLELALLSTCSHRLEPLEVRQDEEHDNPERVAAITHLIERGILDVEPLRFASKLWARAFYEAGESQIQEVAQHLVQSRRVDGSHLNARLALIAADDERIAVHVSSAISSLVDKQFMHLAGALFVDAVRSTATPSTLLGQLDWDKVLTMVDALKLLGPYRDAIDVCQTWSKSVSNQMVREVIAILEVRHMDSPREKERRILEVQPKSRELFRRWLGIAAGICDRATMEFFPIDTADRVRRICYQLVVGQPPDYEWVDPGDPELAYGICEEIRHYQAACQRSWNQSAHSVTRRLAERMQVLAAAFGIESMLAPAGQFLAAVTYEAGPMGDAVQASWALTGKLHTSKLALQLVNTTAAELNFGRLGMALRCLDAAADSTDNADPENRESVHALTAWCQSRLGHFNDIPENPKYDLVDNRRCHLETLAHRDLATGRLEEGRKNASAVLDLDAPPDERYEFLADWLMLELDQEDLSGAQQVYNALEKPQQLPPRVLAKVRLAATQFLLRRQLLDPGSERLDNLEQLLLFVRRELKNLQLGQLYWRTHHALALFYDDNNDKERASLHWDLARGEVQRLLDSLGRPDHRAMYAELPGIRQFRRESLQRK